MPPRSRPTGFVPPFLLKEITKSDACSPESQRAAAETLRHDDSRAMTPKSSQEKRHVRAPSANSSTDGEPESGKSDDGSDGQSGASQGAASNAGPENPFKKRDEKPNQPASN